MNDREIQAAAARDRRVRRRIAGVGAAVVVLGAGGAVYLATSDDPGARYALESVDDPRPRGVIRGANSARERERARKAGERLARDLDMTGAAGTSDPSATPGGAFLGRRGLAAALEQVGDRGSRVVTLVATATQVDATVVGEDGRLRSVRVRADGVDVDVLGAGPPASVPLPGVDDLDPAAPARLARAGRGEATSATLTVTGQGHRWAVVLTDGHTVIGDARGRRVG